MVVGLILDIGNIIFTIANIPQIVTAIKNRKNLRGLSSGLLAGYMFATCFFFTAGVLTGGYMTAILSAFNEVLYAVQLYWKFKYRHAKNC